MLTFTACELTTEGVDEIGLDLFSIPGVVVVDMGTCCGTSLPAVERSSLDCLLVDGDVLRLLTLLNDLGTRFGAVVDGEVLERASLLLDAELTGLGGSDWDTRGCGIFSIFREIVFSADVG